MNTYITQHQAICPNDESLRDNYTITIRTPETLMVEEIILALRDAPKKTYHEDLATYLRHTLGAEITVEGWHHGVFVTATRK